MGARHPPHQQAHRHHSATTCTQPGCRCSTPKPDLDTTYSQLVPVALWAVGAELCQRIGEEFRSLKPDFIVGEFRGGTTRICAKFGPQVRPLNQQLYRLSQIDG